jgi:hypothetical protein
MYTANVEVRGVGVGGVTELADRMSTCQKNVCEKHPYRVLNKNFTPQRRRFLGSNLEWVGSLARTHSNAFQVFTVT